MKPAPAPPRTSSTSSSTHTDRPDLSSLPYPPYRAGFFSVLFFHWVGPLLERARTGPITAADLFAAPIHMHATHYVRQLYAAYRHYIRRPSPPTSFILFRAILRAYNRPFFYPLWLLRSLHMCMVMTRPLVLRQLLLWVERSELGLSGGGGGNLFSFSFASWSQVDGGVYWAVVLSLMTMVQALLAHHFWWRGMQLALSVRGACIGLIYSKALTLHTRYRAEYSSGRISNLASVDCDNMLYFYWDPIFEIFFAPTTVLLCITGLLLVLGWSALVGVGVLALSLLISTYTAKKQSQVQEVNMELSDQRVSAVQEVLSSIKLIKLYSWQLPFHRVISHIRHNQEIQLWRTQLIAAINHCLGMTTTLFVSLASFYTYYATVGALDATTAFTALMLFNQLRIPLYNLPDSITAAVNMRVSQARIEEFLACEDREEYVKVREAGQQGEEVVVEDGWFDWGGGRVDGDADETKGKKQHDKKTNGATAAHPHNAATKQTNGSQHEYHTIDVAPSSTPVPVLQSLSVRFPPHLLSLIIGRVGSGKSSLLLSLLSEMHMQRGTVTVPRSQLRIAYTAQVPFLASASLRSNILFGLPYDADWYHRVLEACALDVDIGRFAAGDNTIVGENGLTLSGGQKMRVSVARAVYARADLYLFDEPLGAVDAHVGLHLFDRLFGADGLLRGRTVLLVSHQVQYAPRCDVVIMMDGGRVVEMGSYEQLQAKGIDFRAIVSDAHTGTGMAHVEESKEERKEAPQWLPPALPPARPDDERKEPDDDSIDTPDAAMSASTATQPPSATPAPASALATTAKDATSIAVTHTSTTGSEDITNETLNVGQMRWTVYKQYLLSGTGLLGWSLVLALLLSSEAAFVASEYVIAALTSAASDDQARFLQYYLYLLIASTVLLLGRCAYLAYICLSSSNTLHRRLFLSLLRAPQWWLETTPTGRILNRAGKDQTMADQQLPNVMQEVAACAAGVFGILTLTVIIIPLSLPFLAVIALVYRWIQRNYRPASVALKRLESVTRSPIYQHLGETATGLLTIRAYDSFGSVSRAIRECYHRVDENSRVYFMQFACHRWMGLRLEALGAFTVLTCTTVSLFLLPSLSAGLVGLLVTTSLSLTGDLHWLVRQRTELEVQLNAVERIIEYANIRPEESDERWNVGVKIELLDEQQRNRSKAAGSVPQLALPISPSRPSSPPPSVDLSPHSTAVLIPPPTWPEHGRIEFHALTAAYRPPPDDVAVLHDLSAVINAGEKVGIVGRTGAGKSTVSLCLFRLMEAKSGYITIDGYPIHRIPLHLLRSRLMIVPQDPVLFAHSLRYNLDPFKRCSDEQLWSVLEQVGLHSLVTALPGQLEWRVSDGGENLSVGQRQLLCLARALLRRCRVVVMDEASASLDLESDSVMKAVIAREFVGCTVLTIAHRLNTVLTSDRIMVFEAGRLREFDKPVVLLRDAGGLLAQLLRDAESMTSEVRGSRSDLA